MNTRTASTTRLSSFSVAMLPWQHSITPGCTSPRECATGRSYWFAENNALRLSRSDKYFERGSARRAD
jgi:hypothetical protein